jgi:hypothetical protein
MPNMHACRTKMMRKRCLFKTYYEDTEKKEVFVNKLENILHDALKDAYVQSTETSLDVLDEFTK